MKDRILDYCQKRIKGFLINSGIKPSYKLLAAYQCLAFGQWLKRNGGKPVFGSREELWGYINSDIVKNSAIDFLEFGVFRGDSIREWRSLNSNENSAFFGFDTFYGMPEDWKGAFRTTSKGSITAGGEIPEIKDPRVRFIKGTFYETLPSFLEDYRRAKQLVIHCDADIYASTLCVLSSLSRHITKGTVIIFDEFDLVNHEFRATCDFIDAFKKSYKVLALAKPLYNHVAIQFL